MNVIFLKIFIFVLAMFGLLSFLIILAYYCSHSLLHVHVQSCHRGAVCQGADEAVQVHAGRQRGRVSVLLFIMDRGCHIRICIDRLSLV